jgi:hypothetical protein
MLAIPTQTTISVAWFNECFAQAGFSAQIKDFNAEQIGTGQIGKCIRYSFNFSGSNVGDLPLSLIGKFPADDENSRQTGVALQNFLKEVRFYQELQGSLTIKTPKCYYAEIVDQGPDFFILLEDLAPGQQGDQLLGCDPTVAKAALTELVGLHAPSWGDESLRQLAWLRDEEAALTSTTMDMYRALLGGFIDRFGPRLAEDERWIIKRVGEVTDSPLNASFPETFSLIHVDYRLDNLMIDRTAGGCEITALDWQSVTLGSPLNDVAYFIGAGLEAQIRRPVEEALVRSYHQNLLATGIKDFSWQMCWQNYRSGAFAGFAVTVIASMLVQRTERGDEMFTTMAKRHARHALDLNAQDFLVQ